MVILADTLIFALDFYLLPLQILAIWEIVIYAGWKQMRTLLERIQANLRSSIWIWNSSVIGSYICITYVRTCKEQIKEWNISTNSEYI